MFTGLLFVPGRAPFDLFDANAEHGLRLHVRRVFVMERCDDLAPRWLRFVRGVIDSEDLPLNVSRETLQDSRVVRAIKKQVIHQTLELLGEIAERPDDYEKFWRAFGAVLKEGLYFDSEYQPKISKLLRFESSAQGKLVSLDDYVASMPEGQPAIYYVLGPSQKVAQSSPHLERVRKHGYDVLLLTDAVDSFAISALTEYSGKPLVSVTARDLKLPESPEAEKKEAERAAAEKTPLFEKYRDLLKEKVADVIASNRLTDSPACLVQSEGALPPHIERLLRAQKHDVPSVRRVLELNTDHPLVRNVTTLAEREPESPRVREWLELLYDQALLAEGSPIEDPASFAKRLTRLLTAASEQDIARA
jgi:molecular chaperone HtpG